MKEETGKVTLYDRIYDWVRNVPAGKVVTYGQVAQALGGCSARMVGYAMSALKDGRDPSVPWQRVINAHGRISMFGIGAAIQRSMLEEEGIVFDAEDRIDLDQYRWLEN